ncbi:hypothetical protein [Aurantibacter sp.]|uniref:hypothetical protein n=1 Tax=Aurantibacter sp. TaxID=2807103 RepID=UPI0035C7C6E7
MKLKTYATAFLVLILSACSSDDSIDSNDNNGGETNNNGSQQTEITGDFFPLTQDNEWNYNVVNTDNDTTDETESTDVLKVESVLGDAYTLSVNNGGVANGTMNSILTSGELTATDTQLTATGSLEFPIDGVSDLSIDFTNAKFYDTTANLNSTIHNQSGTLNETIQTIPLTINYDLSSTQLDNLETYTVNDVTYTNVTKAKIELDLEVKATITVVIPITLSIIDNQNVLDITAYYADGVGLIYAEADTQFEMNATTIAQLQQAGIDLSGIPTSLSVTNTQTIDTYTVN